MTVKRNVQIDVHNETSTFDLEAFDSLVRSQGAELVHYRAQRCPVGLVTEDDIRRPHPHHEGCSNGFIFSEVGCVTAAITSNSKKRDPEPLGMIDFASVQCTLPRTYDDSDQPVRIAPFDRFYLKDKSLAVVQWQLFTTHLSGVDRVKFPIESVDGPIIDARGERYFAGVDFTVHNGTIVWGARRPLVEPDMGPGLSGYADRGAVCSIRYFYRPYWYVGNIPHEIRVVQIQEAFERRTGRGPQMCVLHREFVGQKVEQEATTSEPSNSADLRRVLAPMYGSFGER